MNHIGPESRSYDLFGDDSVHLVHIAGHTEGMFAALIRNGERYVLLNADGAASPRSWSEGTVPGICENSVRAKKALNWIGSMSRDPRCDHAFTYIINVRQPQMFGRRYIT